MDKVELQRFLQRRKHKRVTVPVYTLNHLAEELTLPAHIVKVDVQGFEKHVLEGATDLMAKRQIKSWIIGTHFEDIHEQCIDILRSYDYDIVYNEYEVEYQSDGLVVARLDDI